MNRIVLLSIFHLWILCYIYAVTFEKMLKPCCISFCIPNHTIIMAFYGLSLEEKGCTKTDKTTAFYAIHLSPKVTFFSISLLISMKVMERESIHVNLVLTWFHFNHGCEFLSYLFHTEKNHMSDWAWKNGCNSFTYMNSRHHFTYWWVRKGKDCFVLVNIRTSYS